MATLAAPILDWAGGTPPQAEGVVFTNNLNVDTGPGQPVITQTIIPAPAFNTLSNAAGGHTI